MLIYTIWAHDPDEPDDLPWLVDAWDECSIEGNCKQWDENVAVAKQQHKEVRVICVSIPVSDVESAFQSPVVTGKVLPGGE